MKKLALIALLTCALLPGAARGQNKAADAAAQQNARGAALLKEGKFEEAAAELEKAAEAAPKSAVIQSNLAYAYDRQGRTEDAVAAYRKALELDPANTIVRNNLANLYSKQGQYEDAAREFEDLVQRDPGNATAKANLEAMQKNKAVLQERKDQVSSAIQGADAKPRDPQAAYNAARVYARLGDNDQALTWLNKALDLGYDQFDYLRLDPSLVNLKKDPRFLKLLEERRPAR
ncbi:MAG TPA: tetratricopeptide repeat protein [Methylomirabilota bacterium]